MELYQLKTFVAVADEGHLTRAAGSINISQPAVSAHIKTLEQELDVILFNRTPKGMSLTPAGEKLLAQARIILESVKDIKIQAAQTRPGPSGTLKIGVNIDPVFLKLDQLLSHSLETYPGLEYHLIQNMSWEAVKDVESGRLDCAFVYDPPKNSVLDQIWLTSFNVVIAAAPKWEEKIRNAAWKDIGELPWITTPEHCAFRKISRQVFEKKQIHPLSIAVADEELTIQRLVLAGAGLTLMIEPEARPFVDQKKLILWGTDIGKLPLYFVSSVKNRENPNIKAVIDSIKTVWSL